MENDVQRLLDMLGQLREQANVSACFGEPVTIEGRTVIPVARVGYALGMGAGQGPSAGAEESDLEAGAGGAGGAGGTMSSPLGVIEVTSRGLRVEPVIDRQMVAIASMLVGAWSLFWVARALMAVFRRRD